ncbi:hypothetical protein GF345_00520 [Candidatus Woesearchaeota archaeon]|nr:hypothetical protein [Candidatus Woesearchaeota archaeon]
MNLTDDEKKAIKIALEKHLEEVKEHEDNINQSIQHLAAEVKYEDFIKKIIKKLS